MMKTWIGVAVGGGAMIAAGCAGATVLVATYSDSDYSASWEQDSNPVPASFTAGEGATIPIWDAAGNLGLGSALTYFSASENGGFGPTYGPQIYAGPESAPVFSVGAYTGLGEAPGGGSGVLTLVAAGVPEPSTWAMLLAGFAGLGALSLGARRRALAA